MSSIEVVGVLFTDLVGSTGLSSRIGPSAAEELRREHFALLREAIDETEGREVKNLGDGLMVAFGSAAAAVACAVSMQQRIEQRNRRAEDQLGVRIGIALGDATCEDGDYFGTPVIEASRLCAKAEGGQVLATEVVRLMAGARGFELQPVGALELKGLPEPVQACEVRWEPLGAAAAKVPLPTRLASVPPVGYVGRVAERAQLSELWSAALESERRVALISGEAGIGKTRLATHTAVEAHGTGATVLYGRCDEEVGPSYGPWVEALGHYVEHAPEQLLEAHVARHGGELTRLAGVLGRRLENVPAPRESDAENELYLLFGAVTALIEEAAADEPVVLLVDDLHWADKPTLALLKHVLLATPAARLLVIGTYRDSDVARGHPLAELLADLRREQGVERIALQGLEHLDIVTLMESAAGHELDETGRALAHEILRETDGNPFYTAEILRHLRESGAIYQGDDGRWTLSGSLADLGLPQSVREVIGHRVERLGGDMVKLLSQAAVIGREFDLDLLALVAQRDEDQLLDMLDAAVEASVVNESGDALGHYGFAHALISHTLYEGLGVNRRARIHRRVAEALEELCGDDENARLGELAHHWSQATTPVDAGKAIDYARRAGEQALAELAPDEALRWLTEALELHGRQAAPDPGERFELLIVLGTAQRQTGEPAYRETLLEAARLARDGGDDAALARAVLANSRGFSSSFGEVDEERVEMLEAALERVEGSADRALHARIAVRLALELNWSGDYDRRRALVDDAIRLARDSGDERALAYVLKDAPLPVEIPATLDERRGWAEELIALAEPLGDPELLILALIERGQTEAQSGETASMLADFERAAALADELGRPSICWTALFYLAAGQTLVKPPEEAEAAADLAVQEGSEAGEDADAVMIYSAQFSALRWMRGDPDDCVELLAQGVEDNPGIPAFEGGYTAVLAELGRLEEARPLLDRAATQDFANVPPDQVWLTAMVVYAMACIGCGAREYAPVLYEKLEPWSGQIAFGGSSAWGLTAHYLGLLADLMGDHARADSHFADALAGHDRIAAPLFAVRTRLAWGLSLAERGEHARARALLEEARDGATAIGCPALEARATDALAESGLVT